MREDFHPVVPQCIKSKRDRPIEPVIRFLGTVVRSRVPQVVQPTSDKERGVVYFLAAVDDVGVPRGHESVSVSGGVHSRTRC